MRKRDLAARVIHHERLRIREQARSRRRVAHMPDGDVLVLHVRQLMTKHLIDEAHAARDIHPRAVRECDASALLSPVLQCVQTEIRHLRDILRARINAVDTALFLPFIVHFIHSWL